MLYEVYIVLISLSSRAKLVWGKRIKIKTMWIWQCMIVNYVAQSKCCRTWGKRESVWTEVVKESFMVKAWKIGRGWIHWVNILLEVKGTVLLAFYSGRALQFWCWINALVTLGRDSRDHGSASPGLPPKGLDNYGIFSFICKMKSLVALIVFIDG